MLAVLDLRKILYKVKKYKQGNISKKKLLESFQGWNAYARLANSLKLRRKIAKRINSQKEYLLKIS